MSQKLPSDPPPVGSRPPPPPTPPKPYRVTVLCLLLAGCASTVDIPREVRVPTPVPCIQPDQRPERPGFMTDSDILAYDSYRRTWALWMDRALRQAYQAQLEAIVEGCSRIPAMRRAREET